MNTELPVNRISGVARTLCLLSCAVGAALAFSLRTAIPLGVGLAAGLYLLFSIRVADQWEKVAVLRFGRYQGLRGPGIFHIVPIMNSLSRYVDQRVRVASVSAESTLTRDTVPVNVDAIVFWMVWNPEKSILEVQDYDQAIMMSAQTALHECADRAARINRPARAAPDGGRTRNAGPGAAAHFGSKDESLGHYGAIGGDSRRADSIRVTGRHVAGSASRARAPRARHSRPGRNRNRREVRSGRQHLSTQPRGAAPARHEHAVRSHQRAWIDGHRALLGGGDY